MMNIIVTHKGNPKYLKYVLSQLKETNPNSNIILMGDEQNNKYKFVKHVILNDYFEWANKFKEVYIHKNFTPYDFELFCYQRWFCIYEYMKKNNLEDVFAIDSDVLVYDNLGEIYQFLNKYDYAFRIETICEPDIGDAGPPLAYFKRETLKKMCEYFIDSYIKSEDYALLEKKMEYHNKKFEQKGICDMNQIYSFYQKNKGNFYDLTNFLCIDNKKFKIDDTILNICSFEDENKHKKIIFKNNKVFCILKDKNEEIQFPLLHFQGYCPINAKEWIPLFYVGKRYSLEILLKRIKTKIIKSYRNIIENIYLLRKCKIDKNNKIFLPEKIKKIKKLKIIVKGSNNIIDLSSIKKVNNKSKIEICGNNNKINLGSQITNGQFKITIHGNNSIYQSGQSVVVDEGLYCFLGSNSGVEIGDNTSFFNTSLQSIHKNTKIKIGNDCMISRDTWLYNSDGHPIYDNNNILNIPKDMIIGNHVWISMGACILKGVTIPDNCIIGRSALVTKDINEPNAIIVGNPAKVCKIMTGTWERSER